MAGLRKVRIINIGILFTVIYLVFLRMKANLNKVPVHLIISSPAEADAYPEKVPVDRHAKLELRRTEIETHRSKSKEPIDHQVKLELRRSETETHRSKSKSQEFVLYAQKIPPEAPQPVEFPHRKNGRGYGFVDPDNHDFEVIRDNFNASRGCPLRSPYLIGRQSVTMTLKSMNELENIYNNLLPGGRYRPPECEARQRLAILVPYRNRDDQLHVFLYYMHPFLQRQQLEYDIYIIEQMGTIVFNRASLLNIGFLEALKLHPYDCFVFHDVDLIPQDDRNLYTCWNQPKHMSPATEMTHFGSVSHLAGAKNDSVKLVDLLPSRRPMGKAPTNIRMLPQLTPSSRGFSTFYFGGASAVPPEIMWKVNGFCDKYWGWGGEDNDMSWRMIHYGYKILRYQLEIGRYTMLPHKKQMARKSRLKVLQMKTMMLKRGLNTVTYTVRNIQLKKLYTLIQVDILK